MSVPVRALLGILATLLLALPAPASADKALAPEQLFAAVCSSCHALGSQWDHRIGPPLGGLGNRPAAAVPGYPYSEALSSAQIRWTQAELMAWILDTNGRLNDTSMVYQNSLTPEETKRLTRWLLEQD